MVETVQFELRLFIKITLVTNPGETSLDQIFCGRRTIFVFFSTFKPKYVPTAVAQLKYPKMC